MRRPSFSRIGVALLACLLGGVPKASAQPAGSSPEAAFEAFEGSQATRTKYVEVEEAKAQMVGPACSHAVGQEEQGALYLESCLHTMQDSLGWLDEESFSTCTADGIARSRLEACGSAISTFLFHHQDGDEADAQSTFSLAVMKDLCSSATLCSAPPEA